MNNASIREQRHGRRDRLVDDDYGSSGDSHALCTMAASRRCWKGMALDGSADDERALRPQMAGLLGVLALCGVTMMC